MKESEPQYEKGIDEWYPEEKPYYMKVPYGEVSLREWQEANKKWREKQDLTDKKE